MLRKTYRLRLNLLFLMPVLFISGLLPRLYFLQVVKKPYYHSRAVKQQNQTIEIVPCRGRILDRNGRELAGSTLMDSAYVAPSLIKSEHANNLASDLSTVLNISFDVILKKITGKAEVPLVRKLDEDAVNSIRAVMQKHKKTVPPNAIYFLKEGKRFYPRDQLASHIIGYTEPNDLGDNKGLAGIERTYDEELRGKLEKVKARTNAARSTLEPVDSAVLASTFGHNVVLTIDETIQHAAENALRKRVREVTADAGVAVVYAVRTGEILAIANCPSYSLNDIRNASPPQRRNRALTDSVEPGSVMKALTFAMLFEDRKVTMNDSFDCEGGQWVMGNGRTVKDTHSMGVSPVSEIFKYSSNIGTIKAASRLAPSRMYEYLTAFGFGRRTGLDLTGEGAGILHPLNKWSALSMSSIPVGYELQLTAIQIAAAVGAVANGGWYMQPHIVREIQDYRGETIKTIEPQRKKRIISAATSRRILELMELVISEGTGKSAKLEFHRAGGKTGTTKKLNPDTGAYYDNKYIASFCGVAPVERPEICVYVWIDNPQIEQYGGQASGPVFKEIAEATLKVLKIPASTSSDPVPSMQQAMEKIRNKWESEFSEAYAEGIRPDDDVATGSMPNLQGLTMSEVREKLKDMSLSFTFNGSGVVIEQDPAAYETIETETVAKITFGSETRLLSRATRESGGEDLQNDTATTPNQELVIGRGKNDVVLPVTTMDNEENLTHTLLPKPRKPEPTPLPDVDAFATKPANPSAGKQSWERWRKEQEKAERAAEKVKAGEAKNGQDKPESAQDSTSRMEN